VSLPFQEDPVPASKLRLVGLVLPVLIGLGLSGCNAASSNEGGNSGTGGRSSSGGSGGSSASGGTSGGSSGGSGGSGSSSGGSHGGSASGGTSGASGGGGGSGSGGSGTGGASSGSGGGSGSGSGGSAGDASSAADMASPGGARPARVLIYTKRSTPTHDASIPVVIASLTNLFKGISVEVEASEAVSVFTSANLAKFGAVVMVNCNGTPFGTPGTNEATALVEFVRSGGGFAGFHAAGNTEYPGTHPYIGLLGAAFQNTGGGVRNFNCAPEGQHPTNAKVPNPFAARTDETYVFGNLNPMNQVVLRCDPAMGNEKLPGSWVRSEGMGRVFYTTLGHAPGAWEAGGSFLTNHAWPAILWVMGR
jgi:type 1 glutamine amidotransferase